MANQSSLVYRLVNEVHAIERIKFADPIDEDEWYKMLSIIEVYDPITLKKIADSYSNGEFPESGIQLIGDAKLLSSIAEWLGIDSSPIFRGVKHFVEQIEEIDSDQIDKILEQCDYDVTLYRILVMVVFVIPRSNEASESPPSKVLLHPTDLDPIVDPKLFNELWDDVIVDAETCMAAVREMAESELGPMAVLNSIWGDKSVATHRRVWEKIKTRMNPKSKLYCIRENLGKKPRHDSSHMTEN